MPAERHGEPRCPGCFVWIETEVKRPARCMVSLFLVLIAVDIVKNPAVGVIGIAGVGRNLLFGIEKESVHHHSHWRIFREVGHHRFQHAIEVVRKIRIQLREHPLRKRVHSTEPAPTRIGVQVDVPPPPVVAFTDCLSTDSLSVDIEFPLARGRLSATTVAQAKAERNRK